MDSITELARRIADNTAVVDDYLSANGLKKPSFDLDGPAAIMIPPTEAHVVAAHQAVVADTQKLHNLMKGPTEMLLGIALINPHDVVGLQAVQRFNCARAFPPGSKVSPAELSQACGVNEVDLRRLLRMAGSNHIFVEKDGMLEHTAASRVLAENDKVNDMVGILTNEMFPGAGRMLDAIQKYNGSHAPSQSGFSLANNTDKGLYEELRQYPDRAKRFAGAMSGFASFASLDPLARGFGWENVRRVVDVGGGWGPVSIGLAQQFPDVEFIVQDFEDVVRDGPRMVPPDLRERVTFSPRDLFAGQDIHGADVYLFRHVLHNFPDEYCVKIIRSQLSALTSDGRIIVYDGVVPEPRDERFPYREKFRRAMDLTMMTFFGARERTLGEWQAIVEAADERLDLLYDAGPSGQPPSSLLVIRWKP